MIEILESQACHVSILAGQ